MQNTKFGYTAFAIFGLIFFILQVWWLSMTIRNGRQSKINQNKMEEIKKSLEKIFSNS